VNGRSVFRKVSLDRLASPEQLDQLMRVTDSRGWLALGALIGLLVVALMWGVLGVLPETVSGTGILVRSGGVAQVAPTATGRLADVAVAVGDNVYEGQVVARLEQPELATQLQQAKALLATTQLQNRTTRHRSGETVRLQGAYLEQQRVALRDRIEAAQRSMNALAEKMAAEEQLVTKGLLTRSTLLGTRQAYDQMRETIAGARSELAALDARAADTRSGTQDDVQASETRLAEQTARVAELERQYQAATRVTAPYSGRVLEVLAERGTIVSLAEPVLTIDLEGRQVKDLEAVLYVPSVHGKRVRPGMLIQVAPTTVKREEHGLMLGRVTSVSDFPATVRGMQRVLKNDKLVQALAGQDAPYEVRADLLVDPSTPSHYKWTSADGPPMQIASGTLASANVAVASRRPLELVFPWAKRLVGL
jgi:HlyD family secretion protein